MGMKADEQVLLRAEKWLAGDFDEATKRQVKHLIDNNQKELTESFYRDLEFGTGGLRGIMGVGTNRMNVYTVGMATQGLANYLAKTFAGEEIKVAVSHDCRNHSREFAERVADIFASNGFRVFLFAPSYSGAQLRYPGAWLQKRRDGDRIAQSPRIQRL